MARGWFITLEGGEGTGKSTQLRLLAERLEAAGHTVVSSREPGGTELAEAVRRVLLDPALEPDGVSEYFLLGAARRDHVRRVLQPAYAAGSVVLCDRYSDSSVVYQGWVRAIGEARVADLDREATGGFMPDRTVVLDLDPEVGLARVRARGVGDRLDLEPDHFHRRVREGFLRLAEREPERVRVVSADGTVEEVQARIADCLPEDLR